MSRESTASNLRSGTDGEMSKEQFLVFYPQFKGIVPDMVLDMYVDQANSCVQKSRWKSMWLAGIGLYIAHYLTLWLRSTAPEGSTAAQVAEAGMSKGAIVSKSIDGVSVSYGSTNAQSDLMGWASYKDTLFGEQFASMARMVGKGGMYVI